MSTTTELLDEIDHSPIPFVESRVIGWLSVRNPDLLREALDDVTRFYLEKNGS